MTGRIRHCYCPECQDERRVEGQDELRALAAARDKKRDIAALTLNMAISAARRGAIVPQDQWWDEFYAVMRGLSASAPSGDLVG